MTLHFRPRPGTRLGRRDLLSGLGIALMATSFQSEAQSSDPDEAVNIQLVRSFCDAWASKDPAQPLRYLSPDCVYRMTEKTPRVNGPEAIAAALGPAVAASERVEFKILESRALGPIVITHRMDHFDSKTRPLLWEGVGVFFIRERQIAEWSDYTIKIHR